MVCGGVLIMENYIFSNNAFYPVSMKDIYVAAGSWPEEGIEVSEEVFNTFSGISPDGKTRGQDDEGMPAWVDLPAPTKEALTLQTESKRLELKRSADSEIAWRQDAVDAEMATEDEVTALTAWKKYRVLLMRVDVNNPEWPEKPE